MTRNKSGDDAEVNAQKSELDPGKRPSGKRVETMFSDAKSEAGGRIHVQSEEEARIKEVFDGDYQGVESLDLHDTNFKSDAERAPDSVNAPRRTDLDHREKR